MLSRPRSVHGAAEVTPCKSRWRSCTSDDGGLYVDGSGCDGATCAEHGSGVERGAFAAARTSDGAVWVAYVTSALDVEIQYGGEIEVSCAAQRILATDASTATLHLARVTLDGSAPVEVLAAPCPEPGTDYTGMDALRVAAFGQRLMVAIRAFDPDHALSLTVMQLDTATLPPG